MEAVAKLRNYPTSPRKMRLLADVIRGMKVEKALAVLEHHPQHQCDTTAQTGAFCSQQLEAEE